MKALGVVTDELEATLPLHIPIASGEAELVTAVIDTGFNGYLTLPDDLLHRAGFSFHSYAQAELGDGNTVTLRKFEGDVLWYGVRRPVTALETNAAPLVGMAFLAGQRLVVDVAVEGTVSIEPIPETSV